MPGVDLRRAKEIFGEALEIAPGERAAYLDRATAGDGAMREFVRGLLESADRNSEFLADVTASPIAGSREGVPRAPDMMGTRIGPYTVVEKIGEGGFGEVYVAEQHEPVHRRVALKIIKLGMDTRAVVARFEQERQALALMDHPNIAKVFDAGVTDTGRPYFVMELVPGEAVTAYCDRHQLSIEARLTLFTQVCRAVQHAHTKGVIHRDLKPGNVLVSTQDGEGGRPAARVIDFGIAKATEQRLTEKTVFTELRQLMGTPEYMSPEQAEGSLDIDTRTDVYSLGVLLYELLTGSTPFEPSKLRSAAYAEIQRIIREEEPPKPSTRLSQAVDTIASVAACRQAQPTHLGARVRGELDWIAMKALEKDRGRRYESASDLAADIERHLAGQAVLAAPPSWLYRLRKFVGRNKHGVTAGVLIGVSLLAGLGAVLWQARVARSERDAARLAEAEAEQIAKFQESQLSKVNAALMGRRLRDSLLADAKGAMERRAMPVDQIAQRQAQMRDLLAEANLTNVALGVLDENIFQGALTAVNEQFKDQPLTRARLLQSISRTLVVLGLFDRAAAPQAEALALRRRLLGDDHPDTIESIILASELFLEQGNLQESEAYAREAVKRTDRIGSTDDAAIGRARSILGSVLLVAGRLAEAESEFRAAMEAFDRAQGESSFEGLVTMENLGGVLMETGRPAEAEVQFRRTLDGLRRQEGEDSIDTIRAAGNLGFALEQQHKLVEAEPYYREALEKRRRLLGDDHADTILAINNMAWLEDELGEHGRAETLYTEAIARARRALGDKHAMTLRYLSNLGFSLRERGRAAEAETLYREALAGQEPLLGPNHVHVGVSMAGLGGSLLDQGRWAEAEPLLLGAARVFADAEGVMRAEHRRCLADLVRLFEGRHAREPGQGHDAKAAEWKGKLDAIGPS